MDAKIMQANGERQKEIAKVLGVTERTVRKYLKTPPGRKTRKKRASKLDAYREYIGTIIEYNPDHNMERRALPHFKWRFAISLVMEYIY